MGLGNEVELGQELHMPESVSLSKRRFVMIDDSSET
jgi:hypothetical protein